MPGGIVGVYQTLFQRILMSREFSIQFPSQIQSFSQSPKIHEGLPYNFSRELL